MVDERGDSFLAENVKGLAMDLIAAWNRQMDAAQKATEFADVRPADQRLFGYLRGRPTPMSAIHVGLEISRQAAQQSVARLQAQGLVELRHREHNARDKAVLVTARGQRLRAFAAKQIDRIEKDCAEAIGADGLDSLRQLLKQLLQNQST
ncbi:MAG: MarR family transcriptional regulator [Verrucomicrobiota bacterium]